MSICCLEDWWETVEKRWDDLVYTASICLDLTAQATTDLKADSHPIGKTILQDMLDCKKDRKDGRRLRTYFFAIWDSAPDSRQIHSYPAWTELCELLSEDWVFEE